MLIVCSWCKAGMGEHVGHARERRVVSHGICEQCQYLFETYEPTRLGLLLDLFGEPILLLDTEGRVVAGNRAAATLVDKPQAALAGLLGGEVIECVRSREDGGCGKTVHCSGCTIRGTVRHTLETGEACSNVEAYHHCFSPRGVERTRVRVSTELCRGRVLLRIDAYEPAPPNDAAAEA